MTRLRATAHPGKLQTSTKAQSHVTGRAQRCVRDRSIASLLWRVRHGQKPCRTRTVNNSRADGAYYGRTCRRVKTNDYCAMKKSRVISRCPWCNASKGVRLSKGGGSVTKRFLCIPVQSTSECKTRGEEQWHCPPRGEADAQTRKPCHATMRSRAPS